MPIRDHAPSVLSGPPPAQQRLTALWRPGPPSGDPATESFDQPDQPDPPAPAGTVGRYGPADRDGPAGFVDQYDRVQEGPAGRVAPYGPAGLADLDAPAGPGDQFDPVDLPDDGRWVSRVPSRAAALVVVVALVVLGAFAVRVLGSSGGAGEAQALPARTTVAATVPAEAPEPTGSPAPVLVPATGGPGTDPAGGAVVVHVAGEVRRPGIATLPPGARVSDALERAGGPSRRADLTAVNLARPVVDGEQILVPRPGQVPLPAAGAGTPAPQAPAGGSAAGTPLDLNTATEAELDALPGVGPVLAGRILAWRQEHGRFAHVDELAEVQGIGAATLTKLRPLVRV